MRSSTATRTSGPRAAMRLRSPPVFSPMAGCRRNVDAGMLRAQLVDQRRQVLAHMPAHAEEERHDVDPRRAVADEPARGRRRGRAPSARERPARPAARAGGADPLGHGLEGLGPARIARAVGKQDAWPASRRVAHR